MPGVELPDADFGLPLGDALPDELQRQAHDPFGANAIVCALLLSDDVDVQSAQLKLIEENAAFGEFIEEKLVIGASTD